MFYFSESFFQPSSILYGETLLAKHQFSCSWENYPREPQVKQDCLGYLFGSQKVKIPCPKPQIKTGHWNISLTVTTSLNIVIIIHKHREVLTYFTFLRFSLMSILLDFRHSVKPRTIRAKACTYCCPTKRTRALIFINRIS